MRFLLLFLSLAFNGLSPDCMIAIDAAGGQWKWKPEYDLGGRVTKVIYHPGDEKQRQEESYGYRRDGALVRAKNQHAEVILERDVLGRVTGEKLTAFLPDVTPDEQYSVNSRYDLSGNRTGIKSSLGADVRADYNLMGDVVSLANGGWQTQYRRDLFGLETGRTFAGGIHTQTTRDRLGRVTGHKTGRNSAVLAEKSYLWGINDKLLAVTANGKTKQFAYDTWGNLSKTVFEDGKTEHRNPDKSGNLFESLDRLDRKYSQGGRLE
ncbi:MAG: hypothetical protein LBE56_06110, partial [Tannerella sp.]|nr:hypothetical protein [Tannerella sp.]